MKKNSSNDTIPLSPQNERGNLVFLVCEDALLGTPFFPLRPNLNLYLRDGCPYIDKGCMDSEEDRSHDGPCRTARMPPVNRKLDLTRIAPSILLRRSLVSNPR
ncbi:hypothetical protein ACH5RR_026112 [Cinchona calisaya]|uniref:Uncharacterized protein n=1 Tax=Cinchona calisaya TaxID=153742 RepID=A0ABD2Z1L2_9GENT